MQMTFDEYFKSVNGKGVDFNGTKGGITNGNKRH